MFAAHRTAVQGADDAVQLAQVLGERLCHQSHLFEIATAERTRVVFLSAVWCAHGCGIVRSFPGRNRDVIDARRKVLDVQRSEAAEYARFLSWTECDAGNTVKAQCAWHAALRASAETADPAHSAYLLSNLTFSCVYDNQPVTGTDLLTTARGIADIRTTLPVAAMIDTWRVRATAATGDAKQAARLIAQAEAEYDRARTGDDYPN
ncbi:hypothetical protein ABT174_36820 [Streptomyces sparsogenes]|uniref:hypothetical protein n=1 Tax=Streptomyces sparsogenes TaxID=67365 RepID=UPI003329E14A